MAVRWLSDDEHEAWKNLNMMQLQLDALLGRELAADGLSYQDYLVLVVLSEVPDHRLRLSELGFQLGWEKSRLSHHATRMQQRGLVDRVRCDTDRRGAWLVMTDHGRDVLGAAAPGHVATVRRYFIDLLTPAQIETLDQIARTVLDHLPKA